MEARATSFGIQGTTTCRTGQKHGLCSSLRRARDRSALKINRSHDTGHTSTRRFEDMGGFLVFSHDNGVKTKGCCGV